MTNSNANQPRRSNGQFGSVHHAPPSATPTMPSSGNSEAKTEWEYRYHTAFQNFHATTLSETKRLFRSRPSQLDEVSRKNVFQRWVSKTSETYGMEEPRIIWDEEANYAGGGYYTPSDHTITLSPTRPSITTLLHEFRHALQSKQCGPKKVSSDVEIDARAWSLSLYYQCRPVLLQKMVRDGRILHINPNALD
jgi:hypothetical protein